MKQAYMNEEFNPGIINFDSTQYPKHGIAYLSDILYFINEINIKEVLIIGNFGKRERRGKKYEPEDMISYLKNNNRFCYAFTKGKWKLHPISISYKCDDSKIPFMSISFYR